MSLLTVNQLKVHYFTRKGVIRAVDNIDFKVNDGEAIGLIGESGCGKTTLAWSLMRFVAPPGKIVGGEILFSGKDVLKMNDEELRQMRGKGISMVFQAAQNALNPVINIGQQIAESIIAHEDVSKQDVVDRVCHQLEIVGLSGKLIKNYPHELSGGMKQRVMIAIAMACKPQILLLDEPATGLDVITQRQLVDLVIRLCRQENLPIVLITHDLSIVASICNKVAVMYAGKLVEETDTLSFYTHPIHPYSQALIQSYPSIEGRKKELRSIPGAPPNLMKLPEGCRFRLRCSLSIERCHDEEPVMTQFDQHMVACHRAKELQTRRVG